MKALIRACCLTVLAALTSLCDCRTGLESGEFANLTSNRPGYAKPRVWKVKGDIIGKNGVCAEGLVREVAVGQTALQQFNMVDVDFAYVYESTFGALALTTFGPPVSSWYDDHWWLKFRANRIKVVSAPRQPQDLPGIDRYYFVSSLSLATWQRR